MTKGNLEWLAWYVQMVSEGATLQPETHALAQVKIAHDLERQARTVMAMRTAKRVKREKTATAQAFYDGIINTKGTNDNGNNSI